jgi:hypothetical protein
MVRPASILALGLLFGGSLAGALGACGSDDATPTAAADAGGDGSGGSSGETSSGSSGSTGDTDAGDQNGGGEPPTSNPDEITCGGEDCPVEAQACCASTTAPDGGTSYTCQAENAPCAGATIACDEKADCTGAEVCCMNVSGGPLSSTCEESCGAQEVQLCKTDGECGEGGKCRQYTCPAGRTVYACAQPASCR